MAETRKDDPDRYPPLGRRMLWLEQPGSVAKLIVGLMVAGGLAVLADFFYDKHGHFAEEEVAGFSAVFGFVLILLVALAGRGLRVLVGQPEDYYGDKATDGEESYPAEQIEIRDHGDD